MVDQVFSCLKEVVGIESMEVGVIEKKKDWRYGESIKNFTRCKWIREVRNC